MGPASSPNFAVPSVSVHFIHRTSHLRGAWDVRCTECTNNFHPDNARDSTGTGGKGFREGAGGGLRSFGVLRRRKNRSGEIVSSLSFSPLSTCRFLGSN